MIHLVYVVYGIDPIGPGPAPFHLRTNDVRNQALPTLFLWLIDPSIWGSAGRKVGEGIPAVLVPRDVCGRYMF